MSDPWFRPYLGFGYRPTSWRGRAVIAVMGLIAIPGGLAWLIFGDTRPSLAPLGGAVAVLAMLVGHTVVL